MMDDIQEQNEIAEEISGALSQPIGFAQELDEVSEIFNVRRVREGYGSHSVCVSVCVCMGLGNRICPRARWSKWDFFGCSGHESSITAYSR